MKISPHSGSRPRDMSTTLPTHGCGSIDIYKNGCQTNIYLRFIIDDSSKQIVLAARSAVPDLPLYCIWYKISVVKSALSSFITVQSCQSTHAS